MPEKPELIKIISTKDRCLDISVQPMASHIRASDGRDIPFFKAILTIRNICDKEVLSFVPHATLGQEGGTVQDVSASLLPSAPASILPGETVSWDVYDLLIPAHAGAASKIHMFGYRAALNWRFDLAAWVEYRTSESVAAARTPVLRCAMRWSVPDPGSGEVALTIEQVDG